MALDGYSRAGESQSSVEDLTRAITDDVRRMPGNSSCCDCGAPGEVRQTRRTRASRLKTGSVFRVEGDPVPPKRLK